MLLFSSAWSQDWLLGSKVDFDGINKIIRVYPKVTTLDIRADLYSSWVEWQVIGDNIKFLPAMRYTGLDVIGAGSFTGDSYFLRNGWKLSVDLQKVRVTGVLYSDDYETPYFTPNLVPQYPATVAALVNTIEIGGFNGNVPTVEQIRAEIDINSVVLPAIRNSSLALQASVNAVQTTVSSVQTSVNAVQTSVDDLPGAIRTELEPELTTIMSQQNGLTTGQAAMLLEMYVLLGLDPTKPLAVTATSRKAGAISQTIDTNSTSTVVTRV